MSIGDLWVWGNEYHRQVLLISLNNNSKLGFFRKQLQQIKKTFGLAGLSKNFDTNDKRTKRMLHSQLN